MQNKSIIEILTDSSARLSLIKEWLKEEIWSKKNFDRMSPSKYLESGENAVHKIEELILTSAFNVYDEIADQAIQTKSLTSFFDNNNKTAIVILDGSSIREIPVFENLAKDTGYEIIESKYSYAALPSESEYFIDQRLIPGKKLAPSQLPVRAELSRNDIKCYYYDSPTRTFPLTNEKNLLLWSHFPDGAYKDIGARFSSHFAEMSNLFETVWKNIILSIPNDYKIIITSDHGYIFFGQGLESTYHTNVTSILDNCRYKIFSESEQLPQEMDEIQIIPSQRVGILRGRIKNRIQGPSGNKAYRHGGMSLMEMLTPWLVIKKQ